MDLKFITCSIITLICKISGAHAEEVCLSRRDIEPPAELIQGRPGKIGPIGLPGVQGEPGPPGVCVCEIEQELRNEIQQLQDQIQQVQINLTSPQTRVVVCGVGLRDGRVLDQFMDASSAWDGNWVANHGRLDSLQYCWIAGKNGQQIGEWIQVDLQVPTRVVAVCTQGRLQSNQYVTSFKIQYGNSTGNLVTIENNDGTEKIFQGNTDHLSILINDFPQPITAQYFRLVVQSWHGYISLRMEYLTC